MTLTSSWLVRLVSAVAIALTVLVSNHVTSYTSFAACTTLAGSTFEGADGNLAVDCQGNTDWVSPPPNYATVSDVVNSHSDNVFGSGPNNKEDSLTPPVTASNSDNKNDLSGMKIGYEVGSNNDIFVYLGWNRLAVQGAANEDFEIDQSKTITCGGTATCGNTNLGINTPLARADGDVLLQYNFGGSGTPTLDMWRWATSTTSKYYVAPASDLAGNGSFCLTSSDVPPCWAGGVHLVGSAAIAGVSTTGDFGEAAVDLTKAGVFQQGICESFGSAWVKGRTSPSDTASLKDFVAPIPISLQNCATVSVTKVGSDSGPQTGAVFTLYSGSTTTGSVVDTCTVDTTGACNWATPGTGTATGNSLSGLNPGTYTIDETTTPSGYGKDPSLPKTFTVAGGETRALTFTDPALPGAITIVKTDDAGNSLDGATFTAFSGSESAGNAVGSCTTSGGTCTISSLSAGNYIVDEVGVSAGNLVSGVPAGFYGDPSLPKSVTVTRNTTTTLNLADPRKFKVIVLVCRQADSKLYPSAISIDGGSAGNSLSAAHIPSALSSSSGSVESQLCSISDGSASGLKAAPDGSNPHSASVNIPNS